MYFNVLVWPNHLISYHPCPLPFDRIEISILKLQGLHFVHLPKRLFQHGSPPPSSHLFLFTSLLSFNSYRLQQKDRITMVSLSLTCLASFISSILIMIPPTAAIVRIQATAPPTPAASLIMNGFSPRPTNPPGSNGVPRELLRRAAGIQFPPPDNWCGFIEGDYSQSYRF